MAGHKLGTRRAMQSTSVRYFAFFLQVSLRVAIGFVFYCAASSVFLAGLGWFQLRPPPWAGAVAGLLAALIFDRAAWRGFGFRQFEVWSHAARWQFGAVLGVFTLVVAATGFFMLTTFSVDPLCHHGITNSILAYGVPARDLGAPDRFLPYHALGNLLAATYASALQPADPSAVVEVSLDIVSLGSLVAFLAIATVFFVLVLGVFPSVRQPGPLWLCFLYPLLVFGAGPVALAHLMPDVLRSAECYPDFGALSFHPLAQYLARRSAVAAFAVFLTFLCVLLLAVRGAWANRWIPFSVLAACFVALFYSSLDLSVVALLFVVVGLFFGVFRPVFLIAFLALIAALPFVAIQGGFVTAFLFNPPLPETQSFTAWQLRFPSLVGFFRSGNLAGVPLSDPFSIKVLAVDFPWFLLSLPLVAWLLGKQPATAGQLWLFVLLLLSSVMLVLPFVVFFSFSPWDIHRLFFWPTLLGALLTPLVLQGFLTRRTTRLFVAALLLAVSCSSALARSFWRSPTENDKLNADSWRAAHEFRERVGFDLQAGQTWLVSPGAEGLLFMNGARVISMPFGTAGPVLYKFDPLLLDVAVQRALASPDVAGATHGLLTEEDLSFHRLRGGGSAPLVMQTFSLVSNDRPMQLFLVRWPSAPDAP